MLFYQGTPAPLRQAQLGHEVTTAHERGWSQLLNGPLIEAAEGAGFEVFVTTDKNLKYQQNLAGRQLAIIVLMKTSWPRIRLNLGPVVAAVNLAQSGSYIELEVPSAP